jgi:effector-binding domain-containing protein
MRESRAFGLWLAVAVVLAVTCAYAVPPKIDTPTRVYIKDTEPHSMAVMPHQGPYTDLATVITKLVGELDRGGYSQAGPIMAMFINPPETTPAKDLKWQVMIPVAYPGPIGQIANDKLGFQVMEPMHVAYIYHIGPYAKIGDTYKILFDWAKTNQYKIEAYPIETYWSDPAKTPADKQVTEVWIPIPEKKTGIRAR